MESVNIALACTVVSAVIAIYTVLKNNGKGTKEEGITQGIIVTKLDYITQRVDSIDKKVDKTDCMVAEINLKLKEVEERSKSNTHRLDNLDGGIKNGEI